MEMNEDDKGKQESEESDSSSDEENGVKFEHVDDGRIDRLEAKLMVNLYEYSVHLEYIKVLRAAAMLDKLRDAREKMNSIFPLNEDVWLQWLEDEERIASTETEKKRVQDLYNRATKEFQSVTIWARYCAFVEAMNSSSGVLNQTQIKKIREAYEEALSNVGLHVTIGGEIWNAFRSFEVRVLKELQANKTAKKELTKQIEIVRTLFRRQLSQPLLGNDEVLSKYEEFEKEVQGTVSKDIEALYKQGLNNLAERQPFESDIIDKSKQKPVELISSWKSYLEFEERKGDPGRIITLYERAIQQFGSKVDFWRLYLNYLENKFSNSPTKILAAFERAARSCFSSGELWAKYITSMETGKKTHQEIEALFERALVAGLSEPEDYVAVFNAYSDYLRRKLVINEDGSIPEDGVTPIRYTLQRAVDFLSTQFPDSDTSAKIQYYWAGLEARVFRNFAMSQQICESLVKTHSKEADYWLLFTTISWFFNDVSNCRSLFKRAVHAVKDHINKVYEQWVLFEREWGSLEELKFAENKFRVETQTKKQIEEQQKQREFKKEGKGGRKREREKDKGAPPPERQFKKQKQTEEPKDETMTEAAPAANRTFSDEANPRTIFVVNLPFTMNEQALDRVFKQFGNIKEIRLVKERDGKSKGFAYIEYEHEDSAKAALTLDKTELSGRTLKVSISAPPVRKNRKFSDQSMTVYVSNLPSSVTEDDVRETFQQCGTIQEVRLVKARDGTPKGFAYIDFVDEECIANALKLDKKEMLGQPMSVARSQPPKSLSRSLRTPLKFAAASGDAAEEKEKEKEESYQAEKSKPTKEFKEPSIPSKPKAKMLVPRIMKKGASESTNEPVTSAASSNDKQPMNNAEFRKKLLGKK